MASTTQRGYGWRHQQRRKMVAQSVRAGVAKCARCGLAIDPAEPWDLGHVDGDKSRYSGPEHRRCNRATLTHAREQPVDFSLPVDGLW